MWSLIMVSRSLEILSLCTAYGSSRTVWVEEPGWHSLPSHYKIFLGITRCDTLPDLHLAVL